MSGFKVKGPPISFLVISAAPGTVGAQGGKEEGEKKEGIVQDESTVEGQKKGKTQEGGMKKKSYRGTGAGDWGSSVSLLPVRAHFSSKKQGRRGQPLPVGKGMEEAGSPLPFVFPSKTANLTGSFPHL